VLATTCLHCLHDFDITLVIIPACVPPTTSLEHNMFLDVSIPLYRYLYIPVYYTRLSASHDHQAISALQGDKALM